MVRIKPLRPTVPIPSATLPAGRRRSARIRRVLPGFGASLGYTVAYLSLLVLIPLAACFAKAMTLSPQKFWAAVSTPRAVAAYELSVGASLVAAVASVGLGLLIAWVLSRYEFPLKRLVDSLVDLPFALPTAVAGLVYSSLYVPKGWLGQFLVPLKIPVIAPEGIRFAYSRAGIVLVLTFLGIPFVVRALQPVLESLEADVEEAAHLLGASRWQTFWRVILPVLRPALVTGFALSLARGIGEYGSVVFVSGNMPLKTEIAPVVIVTKLASHDYAEAAAVAVVLLILSFLLLVAINLLERWSKRFYAP
ncbi:MAG TPA: sulfate ABC transporter permease subunit CysT [Pirellulales bacterium]|jgi:sulfate transport system permease protein|nr:sulfate ABC transporter permease subunit CysT [Pirellulales bacterium]